MGGIHCSSAFWTIHWEWHRCASIRTWLPMREDSLHDITTYVQFVSFSLPQYLPSTTHQLSYLGKCCIHKGAHHCKLRMWRFWCQLESSLPPSILQHFQPTEVYFLRLVDYFCAKKAAESTSRFCGAVMG